MRCRPLPLCVISCISCGHVSWAVLTQSAQTWGLNPCHCPSPKTRGIISARDSVSLPQQTHISSQRRRYRAKHEPHKQVHLHFKSIYYDTVIQKVHTLKKILTHKLYLQPCVFGRRPGEVSAEGSVQRSKVESTSGRLGLFVIHSQKC